MPACHEFGHKESPRDPAVNGFRSDIPALSKLTAIRIRQLLSSNLILYSSFSWAFILLQLNYVFCDFAVNGIRFPRSLTVTPQLVFQLYLQLWKPKPNLYLCIFPKYSTFSSSF